MMEKNEPYLLHVITKKGAGFEPAENERIKFHKTLFKECFINKTCEGGSSMVL